MNGKDEKYNILVGKTFDRFYLFSSRSFGFRHRIMLQYDTNVLEDHITSIFRVKLKWRQACYPTTWLFGETLSVAEFKKSDRRRSNSLFPITCVLTGKRNENVM